MRILRSRPLAAIASGFSRNEGDTVQTLSAWKTTARLDASKQDRHKLLTEANNH
jgi:hypothetical protein